MCNEFRKHKESTNTTTTCTFYIIETDYVVQHVLHVLHSVKMDFKVDIVKMQQLSEHAISLILMQKCINL